MTQPMTTTDELLARCLAALGGGAAIAGLRSLAVKADCHGPNGPFQTWVRSLRPDRVYYRQESARGVTEMWSSAAQTWTLGPDGEFAPLDAGLRGFLRNHEFHLLLFDVATRFHDHHAAAAAVVNGTACSKITMLDQADRPAALYVKDDGLPAALELNPPAALGALHIYFADWISIAGTHYFQSFTMKEGDDRTFTYDYQEILPNSVPAELFDIP